MKGPAFLWYTILRLLLIAAPLAILLALRVNFVISAFAATFVGLCLSYIFLAKLRHQVAGSLYDRLHRAKPARSEDDDVEDAVMDAALSAEDANRAKDAAVTTTAAAAPLAHKTESPAPDAVRTNAANDGAGRPEAASEDHAERDA